MIDYIQRAIDIQLSRNRPHNPEDMIIKFIDLTNFFHVIQYQNILDLRGQGYTCKEISGITGYSERKIYYIFAGFPQKSGYR